MTAGAASTGRRAAPAAALGLAVLLLVLAVSLAQHRSRTDVRTSVVHTTAHAQPLPAGGQRCRVTTVGVDYVCPFTAPRPSSLRTIARYFPGATRVDGYGEGGADRFGTEIVRVRTAQRVLVTVMARCVREGAAVRDSVLPAPVVSGPARLTTTAGSSSAGCSVAVTLDLPAGVSAATSPAVALAHDPGLLPAA